MKKVLIIGCILLLCIVACCGSLIGGLLLWHNSQPQIEAKVVVEDGSVQVKHAGQVATVDASQDLYVGDEVTTDATSTASVVFVNNSISRLNHNTDLVISKVDNDGNTIDLQLISGQIWNRVQKVLAGGEFKIDGNGVIAAVRGTVFDFQADGSDTKARVSVFQGTVGVNDQQAGFTGDIKEDNFVDLSKTGKAITDKMENSPLDQTWVSWNQDKDTTVENFLKNHPRIFDLLQQLYPDKITASGSDGLASSAVQALPFDPNQQWTSDTGSNICSSFPAGREVLSLFQNFGFIFGPKSGAITHLLETYLNDCQDGVMSQQEYDAFNVELNALQ